MHSKKVSYHILGHPCEACGGLNTAVTGGPFHPGNESGDAVVDDAAMEAEDGSDGEDGAGEPRVSDEDEDEDEALIID